MIHVQIWNVHWYWEGLPSCASRQGGLQLHLVPVANQLNDPNSELLTFRFRIVLFGVLCSPFMLNTTLLFHLSQYTSATSKDMLENLDVDIIATGCHSDKLAITYYSTAITIMKEEANSKAGHQIAATWLNKQTRMGQLQSQVLSTSKEYSGTLPMT